MFEIGFENWHGHVASFAFDIRHGQFYLDFEIENTKISIENDKNFKFKSWT